MSNVYRGNIYSQVLIQANGSAVTVQKQSNMSHQNAEFRPKNNAPQNLHS